MAGPIVTVFAAKGGSGTTTLATNLAVVLRQPGRQVCLVDLDFVFGDVANALQLPTERTMAGAIGCRLSDQLVDSLLTRFVPGLDCLLSPTGPGEAEQIDTVLVADILARIANRYDAVVVDTAAVFSAQVLVALDLADHQVVVSTPEVPALKMLRFTLDTLDLLAQPRKARAVVFNRSDSKVMLTEADVDALVRYPVAAHIPVSRDVATSINRGRPLALTNPHHPVSEAVLAFAEAQLIYHHSARTSSATRPSGRRRQPPA